MAAGLTLGGAARAVRAQAPAEPAALLERGLLAEAERSGQARRDAARAARDVPAELDARLVLVEVRARRDGAAAGRAALDSLAALPLATRDPAARARVGCADALARARTGAGEVEPRAAAALRDAADDATRGRCLLARALDAYRRGDMGAAVGQLARLDTLAGRRDDVALRARARYWRGHANLVLGNLDAAQFYFGQALDAAGHADAPEIAGWTQLGLAELARRSGTPSRAAVAVAAADALLERSGDLAGRAEVLRVRAATARAGGDARAADSLGPLAAAAIERSGDFNLRRVWLRERLDLALQRGQADAADSLLAAYARHLRAGDAWTWSAGLQLARYRIALGRGDPRAALRIADSTLATFVETQWGYRYEWLQYRGAAHLAAGDTAAAVRAIRGAADTLELYRRALTNAQLRMLGARAVARAQLAGGQLGDLQARIVAAAAASGRLDDAFAIAEGQRARALLEALAGVRPAADTVGARASWVPGAQYSAIFRGRSERIAPRWPDPIALPALAAAMPDGRTAVLLYHAGTAGAPTTLVVVPPPGAAPYAELVPSVEVLAPTIARLVALAESGQEAEAPVRALGDSLLGAALARLPRTVDRLIVVPDDVLHRVPFAALAPTALGGAPVGARYAVSIAPSASVVAALWARPVPPRRPAALALGATAAPAGAPGPLRAAADEARLVARLLPHAVALVGAEASEGALRSAALDSVTVLHLAAHAQTDDDRLGASLLLLAPDSTGDGVVTPSELAARRIPAELVVLAACRSARGPVVGSEGVRGLATAFLEAGARSVVATLWDVGDAAALRFSAAFYRELARGARVDDAVVAAQRTLRADGRPLREWAAFVVLGDGRARPVPVEPRGRFWLARLLGRR